MQNTKPLGKQLQKSDNHKNRMLKYIEDSANLLTQIYSNQPANLFISHVHNVQILGHLFFTTIKFSPNREKILFAGLEEF